jgi:Zn-dependent peptidase ImmA (M78 family)
MPRYEVVRQRARDFYENTEYPPVPIFEIARSITCVCYTNDPIIKNAACFHSYELEESRIFVNMFANEYRLNYSLAHETGHIVLDHYIILVNYAAKHDIHIPKKLFFWCDIPEVQPLLKVLERESDIFAAELLMPVKWLVKPKNKTDFENLRDSLKVSNEALTYRLDEESIMPRSVTKSILNRQYAGVRTAW